MKKVLWIALAVVVAVVLIYGVYRIILAIGSEKTGEVPAET